MTIGGQMNDSNEIRADADLVTSVVSPAASAPGPDEIVDVIGETPPDMEPEKIVWKFLEASAISNRRQSKLDRTEASLKMFSDAAAAKREQILSLEHALALKDQDLAGTFRSIAEARAEIGAWEA